MGWLETLIDWIRCRTICRYHIVNTRLRPSYYDPDTVFLHAAFSILIDLVEVDFAALSRFCEMSEEKPRWKKFLRIPHWNPDAGLEFLLEWHENYQRENLKLAILYLWWKYERPGRSDIDKMFSEVPDLFEEASLYFEEENRRAEEDKNMLVELAKLQRYMWA